MLFNILITKDIAQCVSVLTYMHVCYGPVALNENKIIVLYCIVLYYKREFIHTSIWIPSIASKKLNSR